MINQLSFTRFFFAIAIVVFHYGQELTIFNNKYVFFLVEKMHFGVSYFFVLSGFVLVVAYYHKSKINFLEFIKKRFLRIYPLYVLAILLILDLYILKFDLYDLFLNILMIQSWIPEKALTVNYPSWAISAQMFFYLCFPFVFNHFYKKKSLKTNTIIIFLFWLISQLIFQSIMKWGFLDIIFYQKIDTIYHPLLHLNQFLAGNLAGLYFIEKLQNKRKNYLLAIFINIILLIFIIKNPFYLDYHNGFLATFFIPLILFISLSTDKITSFLKNSFFVFLGNISYGIFILQYPVWHIISDRRIIKYFNLNPETNNNEVFFIRLFFLIIISCLTFIYIEKPINKFLRNKSKIS